MPAAAGWGPTRITCIPFLPSVAAKRVRCGRARRAVVQCAAAVRQARVYSSAVERLTADQQVPGSNQGAPLYVIELHSTAAPSASEALVRYSVTQRLLPSLVCVYLSSSG